MTEKIDESFFSSLLLIQRILGFTYQHNKYLYIDKMTSVVVLTLPLLW